MAFMGLSSRRSFDVPCTVEIEQTSETLHAHVVLDGDIQIQPGDESEGSRRADACRIRRAAGGAAHTRRWFAAGPD